MSSTLSSPQARLRHSCVFTPRYRPLFEKPEHGRVAEVMPFGGAWHLEGARPLVVLRLRAEYHGTSESE